MAKHFIDIILVCFYYICLIYVLFCELTYMFFKYIRKDNRFKNIGFFKYLNEPIKVLKGDK